MVAADEMKELKQQVDKLRERLDFMAPMLSLLTFTQDYFQRVECEASVQLMRLKNARLADTAAADGGADKEKMDPNTVETARWLHTMTDLMIGFGGHSQEQAGLSRATSAPIPAAAQAEAVQRPSPRATPPRGDGPLQGLDESDEGHLRDAQPRLSSSARRTPPNFGGKALPPTWGDAGERPHVPFESLRGSGGPSLSTTASGETSARGVLGHSQLRSSGAGTADVHVLARGSPPGAGQSRIPAGVSLESTLEFGGLSLGRGTWANAYRQASGMRRDALRLLCTSGIVTERELADDLTVISEEHIDECVAIAVEMLQRWPPEHGPPPQKEAKRFFEERLAALYMKRAPAPFGFT